MKSLQGMVRSLIGTVADQQDESEKLKHQIRQGKSNLIPHCHAL